jgi:hypothetical protein
MFIRFDNKDEFYVPNNREPHFPMDSGDEIVRGADAKQVIMIPYNYDELVKSAIVYYYNKLHTIFEKTEFEVACSESNSLMIVHLSPRETLLFESGWDTFYQVKLELVTGEIIFTDKCCVNVIDTLEDNK